MRIAVLLCFVLTLGNTTCGHKSPSSEVASTLDIAAGCFEDGQLTNAMADLASGDQSRVDRITSELLDKSKLSPACRSEVITALMKAMDKPNLDFIRDPSSYYLWLYGADILGDLEAAEALDLLLSHLNLTHPVFGGSLNHHPALVGVIKMGPVAIPKLSAVLRENNDPKMRYSAIYCLATIGGQSAVSALKEGLASESDECAKRLIRISLDSFDEKGNLINQAEWFSRFTCNQ